MSFPNQILDLIPAKLCNRLVIASDKTIAAYRKDGIRPETTEVVSHSPLADLRNQVMPAVSAFALYAVLFVGCSRVATPESKPESKPTTEAVVHERKLPSGNVCRVELRGPISPHGIASALQELRISITNRDVHVPAEAFADLTNINLRQGVEFAEFAGDTFLLMCGGADGMAWRAKFAIRSNRVIERELTRESGTPETTPYGPPLEIRYGVVPPAELERVRNSKPQ